MITLGSIYRYQANMRHTWQTQQTAVSRIASGLRIQSAADDAAGLGVSVRIRSQIRANEQAKRNIMDGISLTQTAGSTLQSIQHQLQRIRELYIQAQNGSLSMHDQQLVQNEISQLLQSIDSMSRQTTFNGIKLLSPWVEATPGTPTIPATPGTPDIPPTPGTPPSEETVRRSIEYPVVGFMMNHLTPSTSLGSFSIPDGKADGQLAISFTILPLDPADKNLKYPEIRVVHSDGKTDSYKNAAGTFTLTYDKPLSGSWSVDIKNPGKDSFFGTMSASYSYSEKVIIPGTPGTPGIPGTPGTPEIPGTPGTPAQPGSIKLQTGANTGDTLRIELSNINTQSMGIANLQITDGNGLDKIDHASEQVLRELARYGTYENVLQTRFQMLDELNFNYESAVSRIEDADMAKEIVQKVRSQLLSEISVRVIAQNMDTIRDRIAFLLNPAGDIPHKQKPDS